MEFDIWWVLAVPLFFGAGWLAARIEGRVARSRARGLPAAYFKALNHLLQEQHDKAVEAFVDLVRIEPETVELHFALGNLFRGRGETDRAIRVHQNLIGRGDLDAEQRVRALDELGRDYLKAGLIDRAEETFRRLEGSSLAAHALAQRLEIAQSVRDWPLAIDLAQQLQRDAGEERSHEISHFHCELAQQAIDGAVDEPEPGERARQIQRAFAALEAARSADPISPRSWLLRGRLCQVESDPAATLAAWQTMARVGPEYLALVGSEFIATHEMLGRANEAIGQLESIVAQFPSVDVFGAVLDARVRRDGARAAIDWGQATLLRTPSLLGLDRLNELRLATDSDADASAERKLTRALLHKQVRRLSRYTCGRCAFKAQRFYWQCPGCNRWDTYAPRRSEELERD